MRRLVTVALLTLGLLFAVSVSSQAAKPPPLFPVNLAYIDTVATEPDRCLFEFGFAAPITVPRGTELVGYEFASWFEQAADWSATDVVWVDAETASTQLWVDRTASDYYNVRAVFQKLKGKPTLSYTPWGIGIGGVPLTC